MKFASLDHSKRFLLLIVLNVEKLGGKSRLVKEKEVFMQNAVL